MADQNRTLTNVVIFRCGSHPGSGPSAKRQWTPADLDTIVANFAAMSASGQVPLKIGHSEDQPLLASGPALGWISSLARKDDSLVATFTDMPPELIAAIRAGRYKNLSVELIKDPEVDGTEYPGWALDAVALLGAEAPAVRNLSDLQKLAASRRHVASGYAAQVSFAREFVVPLTPKETEARAAEAARMKREHPELTEALTENEQLRAELATYKKAQITEARVEYQRSLLADIEAAVRRREILPAARERLIRMKRLGDPSEAAKFSRDDLSLFLQSQSQTDLLRGLVGGSVAFSRDPASSDMHGQDTRLGETDVSKRVFARAKAEGIDVFEALNREVAADGELGEALMRGTFA